MTIELKDYEDLVSYIVGPLVGTVESMTVTASEHNGGATVRIETHPDDVGRVIGKGGGTISAVRSIVDFAAERREECIVVDLKND